MESVDLFGHTECAPAPARRSTARKEVFDLSKDLSPGERLIVAGHLVDRARTLHSTGFLRESRQLMIESDRYAYCGQQVLDLFCPECRTPYFVKSWCRSRICEHCGSIYRKAVKDKLDPILQQLWKNKREGFVLAMVTLTVTSTRFGHDLPTREHIKRLYRETSTFFRLHYGKYKARLSENGKVVEVRKNLTADEKSFRRYARRYAKEHGEEPPTFEREDRRIEIGAGWIAALEIGADNNNAHCHALIYGPIRKWFGLKATWEKLTGDSSGCDIRRVHSVKKASSYVLKYITKPPVTEDYCRVADYAVMIKGTRRLRSGGIFYGVCTLDKREKPSCVCAVCGHKLRMAGTLMLSQVGDRRDLYRELRELDKLRANSPLRDLPANFLPSGVTPVYLPLWQGHC